MDWEKFFLQLVLELGGLTGIAIIGLTFLGNLFAERLSKRYELKLNEKLELYKKAIEDKSYVSKTKFDANFKVCCEISENLILCFDVIKEITPEGGELLDSPLNGDEIKKTIKCFKKIINRNMPILPKELYNELQKIYDVFSQQIFSYELILSSDDSEINYTTRDELIEKENNLYNLLRQYYDQLEVTSD